MNTLLERIQPQSRVLVKDFNIPYQSFQSRKVGVSDFLQITTKNFRHRFLKEWEKGSQEDFPAKLTVT